MVDPLPGHSRCGKVTFSRSPQGGHLEGRLKRDPVVDLHALARPICSTLCQAIRLGKRRLDRDSAV